MPNYAKEAIDAQLLNENDRVTFKTLLSSAKARAQFDKDDGTNSVCAKLLKGGLPVGAADCAQALAANLTQQLDFVCPTQCNAVNPGDQCAPWPADVAAIAANGGQCPACCTAGKYYTRKCEAMMQQGGAAFSPRAPECIEALMVTPQTMRGVIESSAEQLNLPIVFSYYGDYDKLRAEIKARIGRKQTFLFYWYVLYESNGANGPIL